MADTSRVQPMAFICEGGLIANRSTFIMQPGQALQLENFEPDIEGGYKRILAEEASWSIETIRKAADCWS
mgnify:CR=1 FL=1